jgi:hypothetical protein
MKKMKSCFADSQGDQIGPMFWSQFSAIFDNFWRRNLAFSPKTSVILKNLALFWVKNANFLADFFWQKYLKNHNIGPRIDIFFCPLRDFLGSLFSPFFGHFFGRQKFAPKILTNLTKFGLGYILAIFFLWNIWSPCRQSKSTPSDKKGSADTLTKPFQFVFLKTSKL